jgi:hypothetical protein
MQELRSNPEPLRCVFSPAQKVPLRKLKATSYARYTIPKSYLNAVISRPDDLFTAEQERSGASFLLSCALSAGASMSGA